MIGIGAAGARRDDRVVQVEERAMEADRRTGQKLTKDGKALIQPLAPRCRVHSAHRDLVTILATHPNSEDEPARGEPCEVSEMAGHQHGMAQRQQVNTNVDRQCRMEHRQRRGLHEAVGPIAEEAHVVAAADIVDVGLPDLRQKFAGGCRIPVEQAEWREHADPGGRGGDRLHCIRHVSTL